MSTEYNMAELLTLPEASVQANTGSRSLSAAVTRAYTRSPTCSQSHSFSFVQNAC